MTSALETSDFGTSSFDCKTSFFDLKILRHLKHTITKYKEILPFSLIGTLIPASFFILIFLSTHNMSALFDANALFAVIMILLYLKKEWQFKEKDRQINEIKRQLKKAPSKFSNKSLTGLVWCYEHIGSIEIL